METDRYITHIAYDVGFNNMANFNRRFLDIKGMTPSEYRKQGRGPVREGVMSGWLQGLHSCVPTTFKPVPLCSQLSPTVRAELVEAMAQHPKTIGCPCVLFWLPCWPFLYPRRHFHQLRSG